MRESIEKAAAEGVFQTIVQMDLSQISGKDREKLSAYRVLAKELGLEMGGFSYTAKSGTVSAPIRRLENSS